MEEKIQPPKLVGNVHRYEREIGKETLAICLLQPEGASWAKEFQQVNRSIPFKRCWMIHWWYRSDWAKGYQKTLNKPFCLVKLHRNWRQGSSKPPPPFHFSFSIGHDTWCSIKNSLWLVLRNSCRMYSSLGDSPCGMMKILKMHWNSSNSWPWGWTMQNSCNGYMWTRTKSFESMFSKSEWCLVRGAWTHMDAFQDYEIRPWKVKVT